MVLGGLAAAATALVLVWAFTAGPLGSTPAGDILRDLKRLEAEEQTQQAPEILAVNREALRIARRLLEHYPESVEALDVVAWTHFQFGREGEAQRCWQRCVETDPGFGDGYFWLGRLAQDGGDHQGAADLFGKAINHGTTNVTAPTFRAKSLENLGRFAEAAAVLEAEAQSNPNNAAFLVLLGQVRLQAKDFAGAKEAFEKALAVDPEVPRANVGLATAYARLADKAKSKQFADKAKIEREKEEADHRQSLKTLDDLKAARESLAGVLAAAGKVYYAEGDAREAEQLWRRAAEIVPHMMESRLLLAWAFENQGRLDDALVVLTEGAKANPPVADLFFRLGEIAVRLKRFDLAEKALRDAIRVAPRKAFGYAALADLYLQAGLPDKLAEAKALAQKAADMQPAAQHFFLLGLACRRMGDVPGARSAIDRALALEPGNAEYLRARDSLRPGAQP